MKKHYPWLWFDADGTLFDYNRAEATALKNVFQFLTLPFEEEYLGVYRSINSKLWRALEQQEITPAALCFRRFELLLESLQLSGSADLMSTAYIEQLGICAELIDGAYEVLQTLHGTCQFAIASRPAQPLSSFHDTALHQ